MNRALGLVGLVALFGVIRGLAHSVWIEPNPEGLLIVRFAEPDGKLEKSPGHLDSLTLPFAWRMGVSNAPVVIESRKQRDHFSLGDCAKTNSVQLETAFIVMAGPNRPGRKPNFYSRWQPDGSWTATPALTLDLMPTGKVGEVRLLFRGQPVPAKKATLRTPDEKEQELVSDAEGYLRFTSNQSGVHLLSVAHHRESLPGFHLGQAYELNSHNAALTWQQP